MISEKLMMALFALDAYSRSKSDDDLIDDVRLFGLGSDGTMLGEATIVATENVPGSSFVAVAYSWNGKTVLSFRGTDDPSLAGDITNGWALGTGWDGTSQAGLAASFYVTMTGQSLFAPAASDVILTGHSLGGGLAGYLSALNGATAYGFDHMVFGPAAERTFASYLYSLGITDPTEQDLASLGIMLPDASKFTATHVEDEILVGVRSGDFSMLGATAAAALTPVLGQLGMGASWLLSAMGQAQSAYESNVVNGELSTFGWSQATGSEFVTGFARHSQGLLVLLQFAQDEPVGGQWISSGFAVPLLQALYKDGIANSAGIIQGEAPSENISGKSNPADLMLTKIAYSVLDSGNRPFGDSAIRSLFNDAESIGNFLNNGSNPLFDSSGVADRMALFAALQAHHAVIGEQTGFISHQGDVIGLDLTQDTWTFGDHLHSLPGFARDFSTYLDDGELNLIERVNLDSGPGRIEYEFYSNAVAGWHGQIGYQSDIYTVKAVGTGTMDTIIGTDGDEQILLGAGNDTVKANGGVNWIDGGDNDDTLVDDFAWADYEITYDAGNERYYFALRASGADPRIHVLDNMEFFKLDGEDFNASNILNVGPDDIVIDSLANEVDHDGLHRGSYVQGAVIADLGVIDANEHDRFTWEIVGAGAAFYTIDQYGVLRTSATVTYDYAYWRQQVGSVTFEDWQDGDLTSGFAALLGTQYGITVRVKDANGAVHEKDIFLFLEDGDNTLFGTPGNDVLQGGAGRTVIAGLGGADRINDPDWLVLDYSASNAGVKLDRASNADTIFEGYGGHAQGDVVVLSWTSVRYDIIGSNFKDEILYAYEVFSGGGDDIITGSKIVHAGDGYDTVNVTSYTDYVDFDTGGGALKLADSTQRYFVDMELGAYQRLSGSTVVHNLTVVGDYDKITGSNYNDTIYGTSGNDRIYGGGGTDTLVGRDGDDYIEGAGTLFGNSGNDTLIQTGNGVAWGDEGADILRATASGGVLVGGTGDDTLTAAATSVWLIGGAGADAMIGTGTSFLGYSTATTGVTLTSVNGSGSGSGGDAAGDVFSGILNIEGTTYADNFTVTMQNNAKLWAGAGNDTVIVWHNSNSSQLYGESGDDHITSLSTFGQTFGAEGNDTLIGGGTLDGGTGNDVIIGDNYNGVQIGGDGDDIIDSGAGDDTINFGTGGFDKFIFKTGHGRDSLFGAESHDVVQLVGIAAFDSMQDVAAHMGFNYGSAYLEMGYKDDYPEIYGPNAPHEYIGSIRFFQQSISTVLALDWEFA